MRLQTALEETRNKVEEAWGKLEKKSEEITKIQEKYSVERQRFSQREKQLSEANKKDINEKDEVVKQMELSMAALKEKNESLVRKLRERSIEIETQTNMFAQERARLTFREQTVDENQQLDSIE